MVCNKLFKKNNISYLINKDGNIINSISDNQTGKEFVVYLDYKLQLKGYQKKQFDPFCRRSRINFYYDGDKSLVTTVGQLNFFRWTIQNSVLTYISEHLEEIESDMNTCYKAIYNLEKIRTLNPREGNVKNYLFLQQKNLINLM